MILPTVIIVGVIKSGSTFLWNLFKMNNYSYLIEKEGRFFSNMSTIQKGGVSKNFQNRGYRELNEYFGNFIVCDRTKVIDASCDYFYHYELSIKNIHKTYKNLNLKLPTIIVILRNPVDRIWSLFNHIYRLDKKNYSFTKLFHDSKLLMKKNYSWVYDLQGNALSYEACNAYYQNFENTIFIDYECITNKDYLNSKLAHLIDVRNYPDIVNSNHYKTFRSNFLQKIIEYEFYPSFLKKNDLLISLKKSLKRFNLGKEIFLNENYVKIINDFSREDYEKTQKFFKI